MNNRDVAHAWARQNKAEGGRGNLYFKGPTVYSYGQHFPIATFTDKRDTDGNQIVLFTTRGYSISTNKHIGYVRNALADCDVRVMAVDDVLAFSAADHFNNLADLARKEANMRERSARARVHGQQYREATLQLAADRLSYCHAFCGDC